MFMTTKILRWTAGKAHIAEFGGQVIELAHSGERFITFSLGGGEIHV